MRRLERSGIRPISALVDVTNYVMLELGQPLHAFDAAKLEGGIHVRFARAGEKLTLLNGETPPLDAGVPRHRRRAKAVALAGIMGGAGYRGDARRRATCSSRAHSSLPTRSPARSRAARFRLRFVVPLRARRRFRAERSRALERATQLVHRDLRRQRGPGDARRAQPARARPGAPAARSASSACSGMKLDGTRSATSCGGCASSLPRREGEFRVTPPSYRFDIAIEEDLIEELARIHGYDRIPATLPAAPARHAAGAGSETRPRLDPRALLVARDYQEIVSYSFVDSRAGKRISPATPRRSRSPIRSRAR